MIKEIKDILNKTKRIGFFTGAGISTSCGIPDFRGEKGLYSYAKKKYSLPYPEAIFDIDYFEENPKPFFLLSKEMLSADVYPSLAHLAIADLEKSGKETIVVTQNIDMLHEKAGSENVINCHGSYTNGTCRKCNEKFSYSHFIDDILNSRIPKCNCGGVIKPDVTFFGESLPMDFYNLLERPPKLDIVFAIGTSLQVEPAASFVKYYLGKIPTVLVNMGETPYDRYFDYVVNMKIDDFFKEL